MKASRIEELDRLAMDFTQGNLDRRVVWSMNYLESWFVLTLAAMYSCTMVGTMSREQCCEFKFRLAGIFRKFAQSAAEVSTEQKRWCDVNMKAGLKLSEAMRELHLDKPNAERFIGAVMEAVDILTLTNVHFKLTAAKMNDPDFLKNATDTVIAHADEWQERLQNNIRWDDYMTLLQRFYEEKVDSGEAALAASLDPEQLRNFARRNIPVKTDYPKRIANSLKAVYSEERRGM